MLIDSHQHFWRIGHNECTWPDESLKPIYRDFLPVDLQGSLERCGIAGTVLVQSQPSILDTEWCLQLAAETPFVRAVVGWVDFAAPDAVAQIERLARQPKLRGLRPMLQNLPDDEWILDGRVAPALDAMVQLDLRFDALVYPRHLPVIAELARRHPRLQIVIDHAAKPNIAVGELEPWRSDLADVARNQSIRCKVSGLLTEAASEWRTDHLIPYVNHIRSVFGAERMMWGSDWPVLNLAADYAQWWRIANELLPANEMATIAGETARAFYKLG
jgi:L-fuconolactonase